MRKKSKKSGMPKEVGEILSGILSADGSEVDQVLEELILGIIKQRFPHFGKVILPLELIAFAISTIDKEANSWVESIGREIEDRRQHEELYYSILIPLAALHAIRRDKIEQNKLNWLRGEASTDQTRYLDQEAWNTYQENSEILRLFFRSVLQKHGDLVDAPWDRFYRDWRVRKGLRDLDEHLRWVPLPILEEHFGKPDRLIRRRGDEIAVHEIVRDATPFGDRVEITLFSASGEELGKEERFAVGRYDIEEAAPGERFRSGEGAAADSVQKTSAPPRAVKRLFEAWQPNAGVTWHEDGWIELRPPPGRFTPRRGPQVWRWDPASNSFFKVKFDPDSPVPTLPRATAEAGAEAARPERAEGARRFSPRAPWRQDDEAPSGAEALSDFDAAKGRLLQEHDGWFANWTSDRTVELSWSVETNTGTEWRWLKYHFDPAIGTFKLIDHKRGTHVPTGRQRGSLELDKGGNSGSKQWAGISDPGATATARLDPASPHFDAQSALLYRLEEMQEARRAEAPPPHENHAHLPHGRLLLTSAKRSGEYKGHLTVPVPERRPPPSRRERLDAVGAYYGDLLRQAKGTPMEEAVLKDFAVAFQAVQLDQDQRDRETAWAHATKADPELGGRNLAQSLQSARYGLDRFGDPELYDYLDDSGLGNHPEVIRMFKRASEAAKGERQAAPVALPTPHGLFPKKLYIA